MKQKKPNLFNRLTGGVRTAQQGAQSMLRIGKTMGVVSPKAASWLIQRRKPEATEVRDLFQQLGATYIKLGQFIASSPSLFPPDYVEAFQDCLDQVQPIPFEEVRKVMESSLDKPISSLFSHIDPKPLASASIAQVHAATLTSGEDVVIKVQKPGVATIISTDMNVIFVMSRLMELVSPGMSKESITDIVSTMYQSMADECDFIKEANNLDSFNLFLQHEGITEVTAPRPYRQASSEQVLTMERFHGVPLVDYDELRQYTDNPAAVLITGMNTWLASLTKCEVFHADLHGGNIMLLTDGRLGFIDFGMVGHIKPEAWKAMLSLIEGIDRANYQQVAEAMVTVGMTSQKVDSNKLAADIKNLVEQTATLNPNDSTAVADDINQLMIDLAQIGKSHGIRFPASFTLLMKQFLYFDRYIQLLIPDMDLFSDPRMQF